jgi:hypothetical protein
VIFRPFEKMALSLPDPLLEAARRNSAGAGNHRGDTGAVLMGGNDRGNDDGMEEEIAHLFADNVRSLLGCAVLSGLGECNVRLAHYPMLAGAAQSNMDAVFVGTASCTPGTMMGGAARHCVLIGGGRPTRGSGMASRTTAAGEGSDGEGGRVPPGHGYLIAAN